MRGATRSIRIARERYRISIHAPHARSDELHQPLDKSQWTISIHAPHARSDTQSVDVMYICSDFNPRSSCEERLEMQERPVQMITKFQSTLLMRGATVYRVVGKWITADISIHAPHARSDLTAEQEIAGCRAFQSTLLMRGAT